MSGAYFVQSRFAFRAAKLHAIGCVVDRLFISFLSISTGTTTLTKPGNAMQVNQHSYSIAGFEPQTHQTTGRSKCK
eukprot:5108958-Amphidinium_carterae.1